MKRAELVWCLGIAGMLAVLTSAPYFAGLATQGSAWAFTGSVFAVEDGNSYIAKMRLGTSGEWLFRTPYSDRSQAGIPAFLPYMLLGKLAGSTPTHRTLVLLYHALRILAIPLAVAATYRFLAEWVGSVRWRRWGTVLGTLAGGLGWALLFGRPAAAPPEFYSPEAFGFLAYYGIPHLVLARAALLAGVIWHLQDVRDGRWGWRAGLAWGALALLQPLAMASAAAAVLAHAPDGLRLRADGGRGSSLQAAVGARRGGWLRAAGGALALPAPYMLYLGAAYAREPSLQAWAAQNLLPSPPLWQYLVSFLPLLPLAVLGARQLRGRGAGSLMTAWPLMLLVLAYAPVGVQRRLVEGIWPVLVALSVVALARPQGSPARAAWLGRGVLLLCLPTSVLLLAGGMRIGLDPMEPAFRPAAEVAAFDWLAEHAPAGSVVLSSFQTGNPLPAWAAVRVVIGHGPETAGLTQLRPEVAEFFAPGMSDAARVRFLAEHSVDYVFWGPHERLLGAWNPSEAAFLTTEVESAEYAVFRVLQP